MNFTVKYHYTKGTKTQEIDAIDIETAKNYIEVVMSANKDLVDATIEYSVKECISNPHFDEKVGALERIRADYRRGLVSEDYYNFMMGIDAIGLDVRNASVLGAKGYAYFSTDEWLNAYAATPAECIRILKNQLKWNEVEQNWKAGYCPDYVYQYYGKLFDQEKDIFNISLDDARKACGIKLYPVI